MDDDFNFYEEDKIEEIHGLQAKLEQLRKTAEAEKQLVADTIEKEKQAQHENLKRELEIFQLFDLRRLRESRL